MDAPPELCPAGYYAAAGDAICRMCQAGYYCPKPDTETAVTGKQYAIAGSSTVKDVTPGYGFVSNSAEPVLCGEGTYWRSSDKSCQLCGAGKFCPIDTSSTPNRVGTSELTCPTGFYTDKTG